MNPLQLSFIMPTAYCLLFALIAMERLSGTLQMPAAVILSEAKNLMDSGTYCLEILRSAPQNDVVGQSLEGD